VAVADDSLLVMNCFLTKDSVADKVEMAFVALP